MNEKMPVLFISHGSPMNAISNNSYTAAIGKAMGDIKTPKVILVVSAHWETKGTFVTSAENPKQIYDFYGFPKELTDYKYEPPGDKDFAKRLQEDLKEFNVTCTEEWGIDHGAWCILAHMYPKANIPVVQLSIDRGLTERQHYELGKKISYLRDQGVLIVASGNVIHNLRIMDYHMNSQPSSWAVDFDNWVWGNMESSNHNKLINYKENKNYKLAVPTEEHYLPLLYIAGLQGPDDKVQYIYKGIQHSSMSMTCIRIG